MRRKKIKPINIVALKLIIISILFDAETVKADNYPSQNGWFGAYIFVSLMFTLLISGAMKLLINRHLQRLFRQDCANFVPYFFLKSFLRSFF